MTIATENLPDEIEALKQIIADLARDAVVAQAEIAKLKFQLARYRRAEFGRSSEKLARDLAQLELAIEAVETDQAERLAASPPAVAAVIEAAIEAQKPARRPLRLDCRLDHRGHRGRACGQPLGLVGFHGLDCQFELGKVPRQLFRRPAELGTPVARQLELQLGNLGLGHHRIARQISNDLLQRLDLIGQVLGGYRHARIGPDPQCMSAAKPRVESICRTAGPATAG